MVKRERPMPQREQLALIGESDTQMHFTSETWGLTKFYPTNDDKWVHNCKLCILNRSEECKQAPCTPETRHDGLRGYYSIHTMPGGTEQ